MLAPRFVNPHIRYCVCVCMITILSSFESHLQSRHLTSVFTCFLLRFPSFMHPLIPSQLFTVHSFFPFKILWIVVGGVSVSLYSTWSINSVSFCVHFYCDDSWNEIHVRGQSKHLKNYTYIVWTVKRWKIFARNGK